MADALLTPQTSLQDSSQVAVGYFAAQADGRLLCTLCPRHCTLADGQRGLCWVRGRVGDSMVLTTWGRSSGFCVDPIEKKPLYHFLPGSPILSFGTAGCNLTCRFCQNWSISKSRHDDTLQVRATPEAIAALAVAHSCPALAMTYNDPVIYLEYADAVAQACRARGIKTVAVTAGYIGDAARDRFCRLYDAANVDLKSFRDGFYQRLCGGHVQPVLDTLVYMVHEAKVWTEVTTLIIPGENDSDGEMAELADWMVSKLGRHVPLHLSAFHPDFKMLDHCATPSALLRRLRAVAHAQGLQHVYLGNVRDPQGSVTYCHHCQAVLVARDGYQITAYDLRDGHCPKCGTVCPGVWTASAGSWGAQRQPVQPRS